MIRFTMIGSANDRTQGAAPMGLRLKGARIIHHHSNTAVALLGGGSIAIAVVNLARDIHMLLS